MIIPTIGRVVLVQRGVSDQAEPAFVVYVHNERLIDVGGFSKTGGTFSLAKIPLLQDGDVAAHGIWAEWMPYQKEQAKKNVS